MEGIVKNQNGQTSTWENKNKKLGRYLCMILRHKPEVIGIKLDEHGWAKVDELITGIAKTKESNMEILEEILENDNKNRYSFNEDKTKIRANQGHSILVDLELKAIEPPEILWHGTAEKYVKSIEKTGLRACNRMYVHLSIDEPTAETVGSRHVKPVLYKVKSGLMYRNGFRFYRSVNGVWLTIMVPVEYLERV